jgi:hypothetical protein
MFTPTVADRAGENGGVRLILEVLMESVPLLDCAGRQRSPATTSSFSLGRPPRNKGRRYPADPPTVAEIVAVMRAAGKLPDGSVCAS